MPRKPLGYKDWTREIVAVHIDENGNRTEKDFDLLSQIEKECIRQHNSEIMMKAEGYKKAK